MVAGRGVRSVTRPSTWLGAIIGVPGSGAGAVGEAAELAETLGDEDGRDARV